jgi:hypothetical protein
MTSSKLRRQITYEAARLMYFREEAEYYRAKQKAAKRLVRDWVKPSDLPTNAEIRDEIQSLARMYEGDKRTDDLLQMRLVALRTMMLLERFSPRLIGSVLTGHVRRGSDIDIHLFSDSLESILAVLDLELMSYEVERKEVRKQDQNQIYTHIHIDELYPIELTVYASSFRSHVFRSSITGKAIERAGIAQLQQFLSTEYPDLDQEAAVRDIAETPDPYQVFYALLLPLETVNQHPKYHPEGDVLYHSLQVFDLACDELPYDEEFLQAALLHDVGKGIDKDSHVQSGLESLQGFISPRTAWLIEHHMEGQAVRDGSIGARAHRRLREHDSYEELLLLAECDRDGRTPGIVTSTLEEAIEYLRKLGQEFG